MALAGHSLGELSALVAAGALDPADGLRLAVRRGELMAAAAERRAAAGHARGARGATRRSALELAAAPRACSSPTTTRPASWCSAGDRRALRRRPQHGARATGVRAIMLDVAGAFHTPAMARRRRALPRGARGGRVPPARHSP